MMRLLLLSIIRIYWAVIPAGKRRKCVFKVSCSRHVFRITTESGFSQGIKALKYRYHNCRPECVVFTNPVTGNKQMLLPCGDIVEESWMTDIFMS
jgi:uncharacterized protein